MEYDLEWRPVLHDSRYWISENGDILSYIKRPYKILKQQKSGACGEYLRTELAGKKHITHRLVYEAFVSKIPADMEINHLDANKKNNNIKNLELCTRQENMTHAKKLGLMRKGSENPAAKLLEREVLEIVSSFRNKEKISHIAKKFSVSTITIQRILRGQKWKHLTAGLLCGFTFRKNKKRI